MIRTAGRTGHSQLHRASHAIEGGGNGFERWHMPIAIIRNQLIA
jgi:hypothetical protein